MRLVSMDSPRTGVSNGMVLVCEIRDLVSLRAVEHLRLISQLTSRGVKVVTIWTWRSSAATRRWSICDDADCPESVSLGCAVG